MIVFFVACADASVPTENVVSTTFAVLRFEIGTKNRRVSNCAAMTLFLKCHPPPLFWRRDADIAKKFLHEFVWAINLLNFHFASSGVMSTAGAPSGSYNELKSKWSVFSSEMPSGWNWCLPAIQKTTCSSPSRPRKSGAIGGALTGRPRARRPDRGHTGTFEAAAAERAARVGDHTPR